MYNKIVLNPPIIRAFSPGGVTLDKKKSNENLFFPYSSCKHEGNLRSNLCKIDYRLHANEVFAYCCDIYRGKEQERENSQCPNIFATSSQVWQGQGFSPIRAGLHVFLQIFSPILRLKHNCHMKFT